MYIDSYIIRDTAHVFTTEVVMGALKYFPITRRDLE